MSRELILGPQAPMDSSWFTQTQMSIGRSLGLSCPPAPPTDAAQLNNYTINLQYYDLAQCLYVAHARSGDAQFQTLARVAADSYWQHPWINSGRNRPWPDRAEPSPRHANVGGLILRALDGKPEYWDWLVEYTKAAMNTWLMWRLANTKLHNGVREGAFVLHYAVWLSQVLPDSYPLQSGGTATNGAATRASLLANAEKAATQYFGRLQFPDGSWRWDDFDASGGPYIGIMQPFMVGLLLSALADLHQVTANATVKASAAAQIITAAKHLAFDGPYMKQWVPSLSTAFNGFHYFYHGGTATDPTKYVKGNYPATYDTTSAGEIQNARQAIGPVIHGLAYAAQLTGDSALKAVVNEMWLAAYGDTDRFHNYMRAGDGKSYCQNARRAPAALALMGGVQQPPPPPDPPPTDPPPPPPPPTSTVPKAAITSPVSGAKLSGVATVTATAEDPSGIRDVFLVVDGAVVGHSSTAPYSFKLDTTRLSDGNHTVYVRAWSKLDKAGDSQPPITFVVENVVAPPPPPPAPVPCSMSLSVSELTLPVNGMGVVTVNLQNMTAPTEVRAVSSSGQVMVSPGIKQVAGTSASVPFQVAVKKRGGTITFSSGCGSKVLTVVVK